MTIQSLTRRAHRTAHLLTLAVLVACAMPVAGQYADMDRLDWVEDAPPPPPSYDVNKLIEIEMPRTSSIRMGIDPDTIRINADRSVVRYVVVARGPSAINASYEGIRCSTGEFRIYARQVQGGAWDKVSDSGWRAMRGQTSAIVRHPFQLARGGLCLGTVVRDSVAEMVRELRTGNQSLYY